MAEETFDKSAAKDRHETIIKIVQAIRDGITKDVIDYYYNAPTSEGEEYTKREGMRKYLRIAQTDIDNLLNGKLH